MPSMQVSSKTRRAAVSVIVTRADGTVEDHGVVAFYERNPLRRLALALRQRLLGRLDDRHIFS